EEIRNPESAKGWFQRAGAAGLVVMRLVDVQKETVPSVSVWTSSSYYYSLWDYYPYAWSESYSVLSTKTETTYVIETLLFDVTSGHLWWAGTSETTNPKDAQALVAQIVDAAADEMKKDGLIKGK